jgi:hypothetical protein
MKKKLLIVGGVLVGLLLAAYLLVIFGCGAMIRSRVNTDGPRLTQSPVNLAAAQFSPLSGSGTLVGLSIGNPKGWSLPEAFSLKSIHIDIVPSSVFSDHIVINEIVIDDPELVYETRLLSSNLGDLIKNINKATSRPAGAPSGKPVTFVIRKLRLEKGRVKLGVGPTAVTLDLPAVEFDNLGSANGVSTEELSLLIMRTIASDVVKGSAGALGKGVVGVGGLAATAIKGSFTVLDTLLGGIGK